MIHFVGAGCGAPDLITVRGMHLLEKADVIIYAGSLVNPKLLDYAKADCQVYNSAVMTLEEVLAVMVEAEQEGKMWCGCIPENQAYMERFRSRCRSWMQES